jgi:hypothetical protein
MRLYRDWISSYARSQASFHRRQTVISTLAFERCALDSASPYKPLGLSWGHKEHGEPGTVGCVLRDAPWAPRQPSRAGLSVVALPEAALGPAEGPAADRRRRRKRSSSAIAAADTRLRRRRCGCLRRAGGQRYLEIAPAPPLCSIVTWAHHHRARPGILAAKPSNARHGARRGRGALRHGPSRPLRVAHHAGGGAHRHRRGEVRAPERRAPAAPRGAAALQAPCRSALLRLPLGRSVGSTHPPTHPPTLRPPSPHAPSGGLLFGFDNGVSLRARPSKDGGRPPLSCPAGLSPWFRRAPRSPGNRWLAGGRGALGGAPPALGPRPWMCRPRRRRRDAPPPALWPLPLPQITGGVIAHPDFGPKFFPRTNEGPNDDPFCK